ncbi:MAG: flagellar hook-basal body complex protein FliE [Nitrospina sp.]|jgi:flagellar hook-basal body complex protein FliE|nr:flagellar hook-basal body complex protein FliE [Nitrospina sp.]MBT3510038.1 flagellar hook-basal body complex protein FliE [Nitrospina sp.]MBT3877283.1 flagellar hook-basal body complex protein FliE [Nitrospina sp.]MBT4046846.1 flagellar hook-basal body complex protein FliE [Nitrospina sp.]MBT4557432.1 flagellar hook-basal body complex protein FliE [Nitrospina sp.]
MKDITVSSNLQALQGPGPSQGLGASKVGAEGGPSFADTLADSLDKVNTMQKQADVAIQDFVVGDTRNIHETMIAVGKADLAFRLTMQVRNKIVEAYQEVMRTQV